MNSGAPLVCPLINHDKVFCEREMSKNGFPLQKGVEWMCTSKNNTSFLNCPMYSAWYIRTMMKEEIKLKMGR